MSRKKQTFLGLSFVGLTLIILGILLVVPWHRGHASGPAGTLASKEQFKPYVDYLKEFSERRRANIYFENFQSIFYGAQVSFVNVGKGECNVPATRSGRAREDANRSGASL